MNYIIGVDLDNTLVNYDDIIHKLAVSKCLVPLHAEKSKQVLRDQIRQLPGGEIEWQRLQGLAYGSKIDEARLVSGVRQFFELGKIHKAQLYIVSHRTEFAKFDATRTNLRTAALSWMKRNSFFGTDGLGLSEEAVYFESTRQDKVERIKVLECTHFIDDLEETFCEESFPADVVKILYAPKEGQCTLPGVKVAGSWHEISSYFFNAFS